MGFLESINGPSDLKKLNINDLSLLAEELREKIIGAIYENGGHFSSNLGMVETTLAIHYVFDLPQDKLIFDVGHQSYTHKILSGRREEISSIRKEGGLSGFPDIFESPFDAFTSGHAGTSISAGLGYCLARDLKGEDYRVINVVGDGSLANGPNLEALLSTNVKPGKFIVILNDNGMSISKNTNGFYKFLSKATVKKHYTATKGAFNKVFKKGPISRLIRGTKHFIKRTFNLFNPIEKFGFKYVGIIDGHNIKELVKILNDVKDSEEAIFLHVKTVKGKGHKQAEEKSDFYHGIGKHMEASQNNFSKRLGTTLCALAEKDERIVAITAGMKDGTGLKGFEEVYPERFIDVGIAEEHAVTLSAGMAIGGLKPVVCIYSTFLQRAYDQILHDVCLQNLPVVFCIDRSGLVGADGKTHQGVFDISYLRHLPNLKIFAPKDLKEFDDILGHSLSLNCPVAIKYSNGKVCDLIKRTPIKDCGFETLINGNEVAIVTYGNKLLNLAKEVAYLCNKSVKVINARTIKPLDERALQEIKNMPIITLEDNAFLGGFSSSILEYYGKSGDSVKLKSFAIKDEFVAHASVDSQLKANGIDKERILEAIASFF